jgi:hypothetical protein
MISDKLKERSIQSIIPMETNASDFSIPDAEPFSGGQINIIRAIIDDVPGKIDDIAKEMEALNKKRERLEVERRALEDMLAIAHRYEEQKKILLLNE